jgi:hypothetical protein
MSVVSDISLDDFDHNESGYLLDGMYHLDARGCDSEFDVTSTDDDFTYLSFISDDYFDLEEALDEEEEEDASTIETLEETKRNLKQVICRSIQTQMPPNSLNHVSWHSREEFRKRQACAGVSPTYNSLNHVSWHNIDEFRKIRACAGVVQNGASRNTSTARSKIRLASRSLSMDTKVRL